MAEWNEWNEYEYKEDIFLSAIFECFSLIPIRLQSDARQLCTYIRLLATARQEKQLLAAALMKLKKCEKCQ